MKYLLLLLPLTAYANGWHDEHDTYNIYDTYNTYNEYVTTEEVSEVVNTTNIENYSPDRCQGVAEAQAAANNLMDTGSSAPQLSLGAGVCDESWATSLQFGMRVNNKMFLNGSWGRNYLHDKDSAGVGLHVKFK